MTRSAALHRWRCDVIVRCALLIMSGCAQDLRDDVGETVDSAADSAIIPDLVDRTSPTFRVLVPDSILVRRGACPFECCVYGEWQARTAIPLRVAANIKAAVADTIDIGQKFVAENGEVRVTGVSWVVVRDTVTTSMGGQARFQPGDTIVLLDYRGEGTWNVWHRGRVLEFVEQFWGMRGTEHRAEVHEEYASQWWVHVTSPRTGWFRADSTVKFSGADACGLN